MDPPVGADHLQQAFGVGGVQLEVGAVLQDVVHQGAVGPQLLQGGVVGGPAPAGLAAVGQLHPDEQHLPQLLGAGGVEVGVLHLAADVGQLGLDLLAQPGAEPLDAGPVHQHAGAGHVGQHLRQGELDLIVKEILPQGGDLLLHPG